MKKLLALLIALALMGIVAQAEPMSYLDYTDDILEDGSPIYYFPEISLKLPPDWRGKVMAQAEESRTSFYQIASHEKYLAEGIETGGFLFALGVSVNGSFSQLPAFKYLGFSEASSLNYYLELPTDYPAYFEDAIRQEYDAMATQIDYVAENASLYADAQVEASPESEPQAQTGGVTLERMRYHLEHSALPRYFYEDPANMLEVLSARGVFTMWQLLADENGVQYPYTAEDFRERVYTAGDGATVMLIEMPDPEVSPQCFRAYLVYDPSTGAAGYYTVEYENLLGEDALLCGWTPEGDHVTYGGAALLKRSDADYDAALLNEATQVAELAGISGPLSSSDAPAQTPPPVVIPSGLVEIPCPELGFTTVADADFSWDYREGTGITIYTEREGSIPYVIVWQSEDLIAEPYEYIREQYTPHIQAQYGDDLVYYQEYESYSLGGKQIPAGVYTYRLQGHLVDLIRAYDSTGKRTVAFTAKYIQGQAEPTLSALHDAIRYFRAD